MRYKSLVEARKAWNPSLTGLSEYLSQPARKTCRVVALDFLDGVQSPTFSDLATSDLDARLENKGQDERRLGQIMIVEDISPELIEKFGDKLEIDPFFFASYVHKPEPNTKFMAPQSCSLPSREKSQSFVSLSYHKCLSFTTMKPGINRLIRDVNQPRKIPILQETTETRTGLAQHVCTIYLDATGSSWTGIILVDPPIGDLYRLSSKSGHEFATIPSQPLLGGPEDFSNSQNWNPLPLGNTKQHHIGMLNSLVHHWTATRPSMFDSSRPTLQALSYIPLKMVAAEWVIYISNMSFGLKHYETSNISDNLLAELKKLGVKVQVLQAWRRRTLASLEKVWPLLRFIKLQESSNTCSEDWASLREDYEFICTGIKDYGDRLESMLPVVTSFIQLLESRRALVETTNVTRLTILAIVFIPLSYIASLFSISGDFGPGGSRFWVYFSVAVPVTLFVLFVARAPRPYWENFRRSQIFTFLSPGRLQQTSGLAEP